MENQEVLRSKPLSYEASKAVLKSLSLETRETINRRIPALRTVNSRLPYVLENVRIGAKSFEINGREWVMRQALVRNADNPLEEVVDPRKSEVTIYRDNLNITGPYRVNKPREEIWYQLFDEYIRNGTVKKKRESGEDLKIKVTNLELDKQAAVDYDHLIRFIDLNVLENVEFIAVENTMALLDKPEIKTCKNLTVDFWSGRPTNFSIDQLLPLRNQHLILDDDSFTLHEQQLIVKDWITTDREIGTRFTWETCLFENVLSILENLKTHFGAVEAGSHLDYFFSDKTIHGNVITLKMREDRELVMYCGESKMTDYLWTFEMEVVASTTATGTVPTSGV
ncbi:hypothetical protein CRE_17469 [Caenorhabditis remanei]|uniref:F-box associated domain-containing protein n=1 Tax=Caenorhabditis remanei TaxID=31234 RepID=E3N275_CAERE|nr:hypothetical protein CRE_17469 [Caenorhabditis remanei]